MKFDIQAGNFRVWYSQREGRKTKIRTGRPSKLSFEDVKLLENIVDEMTVEGKAPTYAEAAEMVCQRWTSSSSSTLSERNLGMYCILTYVSDEQKEESRLAGA